MLSALSGLAAVLWTDHAKPVYTGPLGEFLVTPGQAAEHPPCPQSSKWTRNYRYSKLYSPVFGENLEVVEFADGKIRGFSFYGAAAILFNSVLNSLRVFK